jgi:hypothetical protein
MDAFVNRGGKLARFGGNYMLQVRFDDALHTQYCYRVPQADPEMERNPTRVTTFCECPLIGRPGAQTVGLRELWAATHGMERRRPGLRGASRFIDLTIGPWLGRRCDMGISSERTL